MTSKDTQTPPGWRARLARQPWLLLVPLLFAVYSVSFNSFPVIFKEKNVLGEADPANFAILIRDYSLTREYGDEYELENRTLEDTAQKHKIHHVLYPALSSVLYQGLVPIVEAVGLPEVQALHTINAIYAIVGLWMVFLLLRHVAGVRDPVILLTLLGLYSFSLSTWLFCSIPSSWLMNSHLALAAVVLFYLRRPPDLLFAALIGFFMLQNIMIASVFVFIAVDFYRNRTSLPQAIGKTALSLAVTLGTWAVLMTGLSFFDPSFRPDHFFEYTTWYKEHIAPPIRFGLYWWKSATTNVIVTSVVSNQSDPIVPQEAMLYTFRESRYGSFAVLAYVGFLAVVIWRFTRASLPALRAKDPIASVMERREAPFLLFFVTWIFLTILMDTGGGFIYSTMVLPSMMVVIASNLDWTQRKHRLLLFVVAAIVISNNILQVIRFREVLSLAG